jgi:hypothetical protein
MAKVEVSELSKDAEKVISKVDKDEVSISLLRCATLTVL